MLKALMERRKKSGDLKSPLTEVAVGMQPSATLNVSTSGFGVVGRMCGVSLPAHLFYDGKLLL